MSLKISALMVYRDHPTTIRVPYPQIRTIGPLMATYLSMKPGHSKSFAMYEGTDPILSIFRLIRHRKYI
jgi:hypothetical protein